MAMTYNSLITQVLAYLDRTDFETTEQIPNFINQAEQRLSRESKSIGFESYVNGVFTAGLPVLQKPGRWRRTVSFSYGTGETFNTSKQLYLRSYEYLRSYWPTEVEQGVPLYYSDYGYNNYLIAPTPDQNYPFQICYLELPEPLSITNQTNWLTFFAPDALLYATLLEAIPFLKNDERIPLWQSLYDRALKSLNLQDDMRLLDRASNRSAD